MLYAAVDAWKPFGLGCAVFRRTVCGRALCAARSGHDVHDGALAGGIPALHRAGEPFGRTAQMEHPVAAAGASRAVRIGSVAGFPHCAGACLLRGLSGRGVRLLGSWLGHEAPPPAPGTAGAEQGFSIERRKGITVWMLSMLFCFYVEMERRNGP